LHFTKTPALAQSVAVMLLPLKSGTAGKRNKIKNLQNKNCGMTAKQDLTSNV
jgi:hypothetical protein